MGEEIWIDEKGKKVKIRDFFSKLYIDEEMEKLETIGWKKSTANYRRLTLAMDKLAGTRLICENRWRDNEKRETRVRENVSILDSYEFRDMRTPGQSFSESSSEFI